MCSLSGTISGKLYFHRLFRVSNMGRDQNAKSKNATFCFRIVFWIFFCLLIFFYKNPQHNINQSEVGTGNQK